MKTARLSGADDKDAGPAVNTVLPRDPGGSLTVTLEPAAADLVRRWSKQFRTHPADVASGAAAGVLGHLLAAHGRDELRGVTGGQGNESHAAIYDLSKLVEAAKARRIGNEGKEPRLLAKDRLLALDLSRDFRLWVDRVAIAAECDEEDVITEILESYAQDCMSDYQVLLAVMADARERGEKHRINREEAGAVL